MSKSSLPVEAGAEGSPHSLLELGDILESARKKALTLTDDRDLDGGPVTVSIRVEPIPTDRRPEGDDE